jgi:predicted acyl esterase
MRTALTAVALLVTAGCAAGGPGPVKPLSRTLAMNSEATSSLSSRDARLQDGSVYQAWQFEGVAGTMVQIDVISRDFDAYAMLEDPAGNRIARDDDSGGGTNARIVAALQVTGTYRIIANSFRQKQYGRYTVRLTNTGLASGGVTTGGSLAGTVGQIQKGQTVTGRLSLSDTRLSDNSVYQAWTYQGRAGDQIQVDVMSSEFDAYAIIQDGNGNRLASDDDSGGGTNARIVFTLPYSGAYRIIANTYRQGAFGTYTLSVR